MQNQLPANFNELEQFVPQWVFHSERDRNQFRVQQELSVLQHYYKLVLPRLPEITAALDSFALTSLPREYANLLALALMVMEVAPAVEYYDNSDVPNAVEYSRFEIYDIPVKYNIT